MIACRLIRLPTNMLSFPFGTIYAGYALWVCWMNEDTKRAFEAGGTIMLDP